MHERLLLGMPMLGDISMMDLIMMAIGFVCFALSIAYVYACDQL